MFGIRVESHVTYILAGREIGNKFLRSSVRVYAMLAENLICLETL